jgi:hypothetical protein
MEESALRAFGRILPSHDYQIAAFQLRPIQRAASATFQHIFSAEALNAFCRDSSQGPGLGWETIYEHELPSTPAPPCLTRLVVLPLHAAHDQGTVAKYEAQIRSGRRPVALALMLGLPYNAELTSGMNIGGVCGYMPHKRQIANFRAVLREAEAKAAAQAEAGVDQRDEEAQEVATAIDALRQTLAEYQAGHPQMEEEEEAERAAALACVTGPGDFVQPVKPEDFVRIGACVLLDGHHKVRAAANLGASVSVLCYGLQGIAITPQDVPLDANGIAPNLYFDSEAIFRAL